MESRQKYIYVQRLSFWLNDCYQETDFVGLRKRIRSTRKSSPNTIISAKILFQELWIHNLDRGE